MPYVIGQVVLPADMQVPSSEATYNSVVAARRALLEALGAEEAFDLFVASFAEFEQELLSRALTNLLYANYSWLASTDQRQSLNRRLLNVLAAARLYLDHLPQRVRAATPDGSEHWIRVDAVRRQQYDEVLGYRVMEGIRNYIQHRNLPISSFAHQMAAVSSGSEHRRIRNTVRPFLDIKLLSSGGGLKPELIAELSELGDKIDIRPLLREYFSGLGNVQREVRQVLAPCVDEAEGVFSEVTRLWLNSGATDTTGLALIELGSGGEALRSAEVFSDPITRYRELTLKNSRLGQFADHYVSNEAWK